jgi:hypothetical protein
MRRTVSGGGDEGVCAAALAVAAPAPIPPASVPDITGDPFGGGAPSHVSPALRGDAGGLDSVQRVLTAAGFLGDAVAACKVLSSTGFCLWLIYSALACASHTIQAGEAECCFGEAKTHLGRRWKNQIEL